MSIAATAAAVSAAATAAANEAARKACVAMVGGYEHAAATVAEMQHYADCIDRLHPAAMSEGAVFGWKIVVVLIFVGAVVGVVRNRNDPDLGPVGAVCLGAFMGAALSALAMASMAAIWAGVRFLFS